MAKANPNRVARIGQVRCIEMRLVKPLVLDGRNRGRRADLRWDLEVVAVEPHAGFGLPAIGHVDRILQVGAVLLLGDRFDVFFKRKAQAAGEPGAQIAATRTGGDLRAEGRREEVLFQTLGRRRVVVGQQAGVGVRQRQRLQRMRDRVRNDVGRRRKRRVRREVVAVAVGHDPLVDRAVLQEVLGAKLRRAVELTRPCACRRRAAAKMPCAGMSCD